MFRYTQRLQKRTEQRLKGFRTPSIRILRKAIAEINEPVRPGAFEQHVFNRRVQRPSAIRHSLKSIKSRGQLISFCIDATPQPKVLQSGLTVKNMLKQRHALDWSPPPYDSTNSVRWAHVIYRYNKNTCKALPLLSSKVRKLAQAYFNMTITLKENGQSSAFNTGAGTKESSQAHVSGFTLRSPPIRQDLLGKLSYRKQSFIYPYRKLLRMEPKIIFKYRARSVNITLFIHDQRLASVEGRLHAITNHHQRSQMSTQV